MLMTTSPVNDGISKLFFFCLIDKTFPKNKRRPNQNLMRDVADDSSMWAHTLQGKYPQASKILQMFGERTRRKGT